jgi:hypothetical protein
MRKNRAILHRKLSYEQIEGRWMLAGNVVGSIVGDMGFSDLDLNGDHSNAIVVSQVGANKFKVQGIATKINGSSTAKTFVSSDPSSPIAEINIRLPGGNNFVQVINLNIADAVSITTGSGRDVIQLINVKAGGFPFSEGTAGGAISVNAGDGTNAVLLSNVRTTGPEGTVFVMTGNGRDAVTLSGVQSDVVAVQTGGGTDAVVLHSVMARDANGEGTLDVDVGSGSSDVASVVDCSADRATFDDTSGTNGVLAGVLNSFTSQSIDTTGFRFRSGDLRSSH